MVFSVFLESGLKGISEAPNEYYTVNSRSSARAYTVTASINTDSEGGSGMANVVW